MRCLLEEARRGEEAVEKELSGATTGDDEESFPDLAGFSPDQIRRLISEIRKRIAKDREVYRQKAKKVFGGIGAKLDQIGASENRSVSLKSTIHNSLVIVRNLLKSLLNYQTMRAWMTPH